MNALPGYEFISAPLWLITTLHILTLSLHFVAMNFIFGGLAVILLGRFSSRWQNVAVRRYVGLLSSAMAATVTLGVAPLLFTQLVYHRQIYSAAIISAWFWLFLLVLVIVAYYAFYTAGLSDPKAGRERFLLPIALVALLGVSFIYSSVFSLAEQPESMRALYAADQSGWTINPHLGDYFFRWLHMLLGALAVGGFFVGLVGRDDEEASAIGSAFFLHGVLGAAIAGIVYLGSLGEALRPFMRSPGIWAVLGGFVLTLAALRIYRQRRFVLSGTLLFVSMMSMVFARHELRLIHLSGEIQPAALTVSPQWGIFSVFFVCFVLGLATVFYMLRSFLAGGAEGT